MEKKICSKCKRELSIDNFRWKNKAQGKKHSQCKECEKKSDKEYYLKNGERRRAVRERTNIQKIKNIELVEQIKKTGCLKCGEKRTHLLDLHHINPEEKINDIAHMIKSSSFEALSNELEKCVVLCSNCHRDFHFLNKTLGVDIKEYLK